MPCLFCVVDMHAITAEAGYAWPDDRKAKLIDALRAVVDGRLKEEGEAPSDARLLRLSALAALARNGAATRPMLGQAAIPLRDMPTAMLADWLVTIDHIRGVSPRTRAAAEQALKGRIVYEGSRLDLVDRNVAPWWTGQQRRSAPESPVHYVSKHATSRRRRIRTSSPIGGRYVGQLRRATTGHDLQRRARVRRQPRRRNLFRVRRSASGASPTDAPPRTAGARAAGR